MRRTISEKLDTPKRRTLECRAIIDEPRKRDTETALTPGTPADSTNKIRHRDGDSPSKFIQEVHINVRVSGLDGIKEAGSPEEDREMSISSCEFPSFRGTLMLIASFKGVINGRAAEA